MSYYVLMNKLSAFRRRYFQMFLKQILCRQNSLSIRQIDNEIALRLAKVRSYTDNKPLPQPMTNQLTDACICDRVSIIIRIIVTIKCIGDKMYLPLSNHTLDIVCFEKVSAICGTL